MISMVESRWYKEDWDYRFGDWGIVKVLWNTQEDALNVWRSKHLNKSKYILDSKRRHYWQGSILDHAHIQEIGLFLIFVDSFSGWPEVIKVRDRKATTVRQILKTIFARNGVPKTIFMDNTLEFCNESLVLWLRKIRCMPYKTPHTTLSQTA